MVIQFIMDHVIPGKWSAPQIVQAIKDGKGTYVNKSVQGGNLTFWMKGKDVRLFSILGKRQS